MLINSSEYLDLVQTIKQEIQQAQYKATLSVNKELIMLYYNGTVKSYAQIRLQSLGK